jgi:hypothetical protein
MEQFCSFINPKFSLKNGTLMEHFGFLIVPGAIIPSYPALEKDRKEIAPTFTC